ncbi:hypothetical protein F5I97DRAFT_593451 [Phlebopus sp. FC_14]|nr:hypothetical protein F5I97DRAFT_593451 [Phlebopus sp. FC_14]
MAIIRTAEAYNEAAHLSPTSTSAAYHGRFLWHLIHMYRSRSGGVRERSQPDPALDPTLQSMYFTHFVYSRLKCHQSGPQISPTQSTASHQDSMPPHYSNYAQQTSQETYSSRESSNGRSVVYSIPDRGGPVPVPAPTFNDYTHADFNYYRTMLFDLGFGDNEQAVVPTNENFRNFSYGDGINAHYTQYPYGHAHALGQSNFVGS